MTISLPERLTAEQSEKYIVSIRLAPGGFSFSGYNPEEAGSAFYRFVPNGKPQSDLRALEEFFFANECLSWKYKKTYLLTPDAPYTLVPDAYYDEKRKDAFLSFNYTDASGHVLVNRLKPAGAVLLYALPDDVYEFCSRSFLKPEFLHATTVLLTRWQKQGQHALYKELYAVVGERSLQVACLAPQGKLLFSNRFEAHSVQDCLYYLLYIWKQNGLDQLKDRLYYQGEPSRCEELRQLLGAYVKYVSAIPLPSEVYLRGDALSGAPLDLIYLSVCEL